MPDVKNTGFPLWVKSGLIGAIDFVRSVPQADIASTGATEFQMPPVSASDLILG